MSEIKHTPCKHYAVNRNGRIVMQATPFDKECAFDLLDPNHVGMDVALANGKLYAAAPDLLKLVEQWDAIAVACEDLEMYDKGMSPPITLKHSIQFMNEFVMKAQILLKKL